jgi:hypothetical protein
MVTIDFFLTILWCCWLLHVMCCPVLGGYLILLIPAGCGFKNIFQNQRTTGSWFFNKESESKNHRFWLFLEPQRNVECSEWTNKERLVLQAVTWLFLNSWEPWFIYMETGFFFTFLNPRVWTLRTPWYPVGVWFSFEHPPNTYEFSKKLDLLQTGPIDFCPTIWWCCCHLHVSSLNHRN